MEHPESCYSYLRHTHDCIIIKWGEGGYYETDYPKGKYDEETIDILNENGGVTREQRLAMEGCSIAAQNNPNLDWDKHYEMCLANARELKRKSNVKDDKTR